MTRRIPELAVVVGLVLAGPFALFAFVSTGDLLRSALVGVVLFYPLAGYTVSKSEDPTRVLPPRPLVLAAVAVAGALAFYGLLGGEPLEGVFVGLVVLLPAAAYYSEWVGYALPPKPILGGGAGLALLVVAAGVVGGEVSLGTVNAVLVYLASALYYARGGGEQLNPLSTRATLGLCAVASGGLAAAAVLALEYRWPEILAVGAPLACAALYYRFATPDGGDSRTRPERERPAP